MPLPKLLLSQITPINLTRFVILSKSKLKLDKSLLSPDTDMALLLTVLCELNHWIPSPKMFDLDLTD